MTYRFITIPKNSLTLCHILNVHLTFDNPDVLEYVGIIREPYSRFWSAVKECTGEYKTRKDETDDNEYEFKGKTVADQIKEGIAQIDGTPNDFFKTQKSWLDKYTVSKTFKYDENLRTNLKSLFADLEDTKLKEQLETVIDKDWNESTHDKDEEALGILKSTYKDKIETFYADDFKLWEEK